MELRHRAALAPQDRFSGSSFTGLGNLVKNPCVYFAKGKGTPFPFAFLFVS